MARTDEQTVRDRAGRLVTSPSNYSASPTCRTNLQELSLESIYEALSGFLGRCAKEAEFDYIERNCSYPERKFQVTSRIQEDSRTDLWEALPNDWQRHSEETISKPGWIFTDVSSYELADYLEAITARLARELAKMSDRPKV